MNHYDEMTCLQYLEGILEREKALELSAHTQTCEACRGLLGALQRETHLLSHALREQDEPVPARLMKPAQAQTPWAWVVSFGLAAAGAYWLWTTYIDPGTTELSQAGFDKSNLMTELFFSGALWKGWSAMWTTVQALAVVSLGVIGFMLVRKSLRRWNTIALVMSALIAALGLPMGASASEIHKSEGTYTLPAGATVKNDLIIFGNSIRIDGTVDGDLIAVGRNITINGHITGEAIVFGSLVTHNGTVDGSMRVGGSAVFINGKIGKNLSTGAGNLTVASGSEIGWGVMVGGGEIEFDGRIGRDILAGAGHMSLNGFVGGNITLQASQANQGFEIGSTAEVLGKIDYKGQKPATVASGAKLASQPTFTVLVRHTDTWGNFSWWHQILSWGAAFVFGLVLLLLMPGFFDDSVQSANRYGVSLGIGLLLLCGIPVAIVIACVTIVGLSVGLTTLLFYMVVFYGGKVIVAAWLGRTLLGKDGFAGAMVGVGNRVIRTPQVVGQLAVGLVILYAVRLVPYIGWWSALAVLIWGFGAVGYTIFKKISNRSIVVAPVAVTA